MSKELLAVVGTMGVGKTSVAEIIAKDLGHTLYKERFEQNPFLQGQYKDRQRYAYHSQIWFLIDMYNQIRDAQEEQSNGVFDAWITQYAESYARALLTGPELDTYTELYQILEPRLRKPSLLVCLQADMSVILKRCRNRDRDFEKKVDIEYLTKLDQLNHEWISASTLPKVMIETDGLDIIHSRDARRVVIDQIKEARK